MKQKIILYAAEGMVLTDGEHYGKIIFVAEGVSPDTYYEITDAEYENILKQQEGNGGEV